MTTATVCAACGKPKGAKIVDDAEAHCWGFCGPEERNEWAWKRLTDERDAAVSRAEKAEAAFKALLAQINEDDKRARDAGLTHDNIRKALSDYAADEISFGRLLEIVRTSARLLAETGQFTPMITYSGPPPTNFVMVECSKCHILTRSNTTCEACGHLNVVTFIKGER